MMHSDWLRGISNGSKAGSLSINLKLSWHPGIATGIPVQLLLFVTLDIKPKYSLSPAFVDLNSALLLLVSVITTVLLDYSTLSEVSISISSFSSEFLSCN